MANIEQDLQAIMEARYGKDVRQSIHDAIYDINEVNEANISTVQGIADTAQGYANTALQAKNDAQTARTGAETAQTNASNSAKDAEAWAVGQRAGTNVPSTDPTYENNAKYWQERANYWYEQAKTIAESFSGALRPMGTVTFANLPSLAEATAGDMYNVSDEFTTTSDFKEGAGHVIPLGSNVYKTTDDKWDVLAGSPVTGIKGQIENSYRRGNVNISKADIGLDLNYKKVLLFSDSYGMSDNAGGWCSRCKTFLENINPNISVEYSAQSGYGFVGNDGTFLSLITAKAQTMTDTEKRAITDIIIGGGWNDGGKSAEALDNAIGSCIEYCKTQFSNATVWVAFMAFDTQYSVLSSLINIYQAYKDKSAKYGANHMDNVAWITHNKHNMADTRHPNGTGYQLIAELVSQYLIKGATNAEYPVVDLGLTPLSGITVSSGITTSSKQYLHNEYVETYMIEATFTFTNGMDMQFDNNHSYALGNVSGCVVGDPAKTAGTNCDIVYRVNNTLYYGGGRLYINDNKLYISPMFVSGLGTSAPFSVTNMYIPATSFVSNLRIS